MIEPFLDLGYLKLTRLTIENEEINDTTRYISVSDELKDIIKQNFIINSIQVPMISKPYYNNNFNGFYRKDLLYTKLIHIQHPHKHK